MTDTPHGTAPSYFQGRSQIRHTKEKDQKETIAMTLVHPSAPLQTSCSQSLLPFVLPQASFIRKALETGAGRMRFALQLEASDQAPKVLGHFI